jgi:trk system potassium uptake protein TrkH
MLLIIAGTLILCAQGFHVTSSAFEVMSGIGTVGLSRGITTELPAISRVTIIFLMYAGRVGSLAVAAAMSVKRQKAQTNLKNITEKIIIG